MILDSEIFLFGSPLNPKQDDGELVLATSPSTPSFLTNRLSVTQPIKYFNKYFKEEKGT